MRIDSYAVAMNAQYFNLQTESIQQTSIITTAKDFSNDESIEVNKLETNIKPNENTTDELSMKLSQAILKNISDESSRSVSDRVDMFYTYTESQALDFSMQAFVKTGNSDIELSLDISLSRSFTQKIQISAELPKALQDPLVISLDGNMPTLSSKTFSFNIDSDGESNQISQLNANSGFLALDKNDNGFIDNGSELFGTKSGDGFADLSKYDEDENGWIDENDAIFDKLRIWQKNDDEDKLVALGEVGIGAIFLGNAATPFSLKSESNELLGEIRNSSFVLFENGRAGIISQIDLAISPEVKEELSTVDKMQKDLSMLKLDDIYSKEPESSETSNDKMAKLQGKIKVLESKLLQAKGSEITSLQAQIGSLFAQMMALLEAEFT